MNRFWTLKKWIFCLVLGALWFSVELLADNSEIPDDFLPFQELKEKIPGAICDESVVLKAPSLEALREENPNLRQGSLLAGGVGYKAKVDIPEWRLIGFLLGDSFSIVASEYLKSQIDPVWGTEKAKDSLPAQTEKISNLKRKMSLDICTALVTPGKLQPLLREQPSWLLQAAQKNVKSNSHKTPFSGTSRSFIFHLLDLDERYGKVGSNWWIPGWVELSEVETVWGAERIYRRLSNPLTHRTLFIVVMNKKYEPLGFFYISNEDSSMNFEQLKKQALEESSLLKRQEMFRLMIESDSYQAISNSPKLTSKIKELQEIYKAKIQSIKNDLAKTQWNLVESKKTLNDDFFKALNQARVNGSRVAVRLLPPSNTLNKIYKNFQKDLDHLNFY